MLNSACFEISTFMRVNPVFLRPTAQVHNSANINSFMCFIFASLFQIINNPAFKTKKANKAPSRQHYMCRADVA